MAVETQALSEAIDHCRFACTTCLAACDYGGDDPSLADCITMNAACIDVATAIRLLQPSSACLADENLRVRLESMRDLSGRLARVCRDGRHRHCDICNDSATQCERSCSQLVGRMRIPAYTHPVPAEDQIPTFVR